MKVRLGTKSFTESKAEMARTMKGTTSQGELRRTPERAQASQAPVLTLEEVKKDAVSLASS